jgi:hypothetical protein
MQSFTDIEALTQSNSPGMTSYIPSITLPGQIFAQPAASILLPIALGTGIGFAVSRRFSTPFTYYASCIGRRSLPACGQSYAHRAAPFQPRILSGSTWN